MSATAQSTSDDILQNELRLVIQSPRSRLEFAKSLWNPHHPECLTLESVQGPMFDGYFGYYQDQCISWLCDTYSPDRTHRQLVQTAREIVDLDASQVQTRLAIHDITEKELERSWMFLAIRTMTMIDIGGLRSGLKLGQTSRNWTTGSLRDFLDSTFPINKELDDHVKLERLFTARNIERVADIQIIWTSNLADHLQLEDDDTKVRLFSHASFLELQQDW